jgi:hypothetical protein
MHTQQGGVVRGSIAGYYVLLEAFGTLVLEESDGDWEMWHSVLELTGSITNVGCLSLKWGGLCGRGYAGSWGRHSILQWIGHIRNITEHGQHKSQLPIVDTARAEFGCGPAETIGTCRLGFEKWEDADHVVSIWEECVLWPVANMGTTPCKTLMYTWKGKATTTHQ